MQVNRTIVPAMLAGLALCFFGATAVAQPPDEGEPEQAGETEQPQPPPQAEQPVTPAPAQPAEVAQPAAGPSGTETDCQNGEDDDGDSMTDCADADCFGQAVCEAGGNPERNDERCSDWIDNDGDGAVDCDDSDCNTEGITVCQGSFHGNAGQQHAGTVPDDELPELTGDMTVEDLIGNYGDNDGERNDYVCSDGVDNDHDGRADCSDFGCRFDPQVTVCQNAPGMRFGVVAGLAGAWLPGTPADRGTDFDVRFTRIQLRVLGQIPLIEDSFFLLSTRWDKSPRLTFALFQVPVGDDGHYLNLNSGSGSLTTGLIISASKHPLLDAPYYLLNSFEQGSGAAVEFGGPIDAANRLKFRIFASGGVGAFTGNVGGRFLPDREENFAWGVGGQLAASFIGYYDRFDSPSLYTPVPLTFGGAIGFKYDERPRERYPWGNGQLVFQYDRFLIRGEANLKYVLDYGGAFQTAWNAQTSILVWPRTLMLAADVGSFFAQNFEDTPDFGGSLRRPLDEFQWRVAAHWYWYRNIGVLALMYRESIREQDPERPEDPTAPNEDFTERELRLEAQFRF